MKKNLLSLLVSSLVFISVGNALAEENDKFSLLEEGKVKQNIIKKFNGVDPNVKIKEIYKTPLVGGKVYLLRLENNAPLYVDENISVIFPGQALNPKTKTSFTDKYYNEWTKVNFNDLPVNKTIKNIRTEEKAKLFVFADPNCGYCKKLEQSLNNEKNITVYTLLVPILGEDSLKKSITFTCSQNEKEKLEKWQDWMLRGKFTPLSDSEYQKCLSTHEAEIKENIKLFSQLGGQGTPFIINQNGKKSPGALDPADLIK